MLPRNLGIWGRPRRPWKQSSTNKPLLLNNYQETVGTSDLGNYHMVDRHLCGPGTSVGKEFFTLLNMLIAQIQDSHALKSSFLVTMDTEPKNQPRPVCVVPSFRQIDFCISECHPRGGPVEIWHLFRCLLLDREAGESSLCLWEPVKLQASRKSQKKECNPSDQEDTMCPKTEGRGRDQKGLEDPQARGRNQPTQASELSEIL